MFHRTGLFLCPILLASCVSFSSTGNAVKQMELDALQQRLAAIRQLESDLNANPNPESQYTFSFFLSASAMNRALTAADGLQIPLTQPEGVVVEIEQIRVDFDEYVPTVTMRATATRLRDRLKVCLTSRAALERVDAPDVLRFRVRLIDVQPVARWGVFSWRIGGFVRALLHDAVQKEIDARLPELSVPLRHDLLFAAPGRRLPVRFPSEDGWIDGFITTQEAQWNGALHVRRIFFLPDGVHVLIEVTEGGRS